MSTQKEIVCYPNNKPWISKDLKSLLIEKKTIFDRGNKDDMKVINKKIYDKILQCKKEYKDKLEKQFTTNNTRAAWQGMQAIIGTKKKNAN